MPRLLTLGRFELVDHSTEQAVPTQPKRLALLAYLASGQSSGPVSHRRDTLLGLFWPDLGEEEARRALRHALHHLRRAVGDNAIVTRADDQVGVDPAVLESDAAGFERAVASERFADALALYRGDFLQGVFVPETSPELEEWVERTRARLRNLAVSAARRVVATAMADGNDGGALAAAFRAHELAPDDEAVLRELIRLMQRTGDRAGALRLYETFKRRLHDDVGAEPEPATAALVDELRRAPAVTLPVETRSAPSLWPTIPQPTPHTIGEPEASDHRSRRFTTVVSAALGVAIFAVVAAVAWRGVGIDAAPVVPNSIAVLPFENESRDTATAFFADGMGDELAAALSGAGIHVAARSSVAALEARHATDSDIERRLGVATLLHGRVQRSGGRVRIWAQLVGGNGGLALWTRTYDTTLTDVFSLQENLARAIVAELRPNLVESVVRSSRSTRGTSDVEAYDLFMKGRYYTDRLESPRAIAALREAVTRDPSFARAWAALARAYENAALIGATSGDADSIRTLARNAAERAVRLDSTLADAHVARATALLADWRFADAETSFRRGIALDPGNPDFYSEFADLLFVEGRPNEALAAVQRLRELDPLSVGGIVLKQYVLVMLGRLDEARAETKRGLELDSSFVPLYQNAGIAEAFDGHADRALALLTKAYQLDPRLFGNAAYALFGNAVAARWGDVDRIRAEVERDGGGNSPDFYGAAIGIVNGDRSVAIAATERGFERHEPLFLFVSAACDPMFDLLKGDARYEALLSRYGMRSCPSLDRWPIPSRPK